MQLRYLTMNQLSEITGKDRRTIKQRLALLEPHSADGRAQYYDAHLAIDLIVAHESAKGLERKMQQEQLRYEAARREKIEIEVAKIKGDLVPIEDVAKTVEREYEFVRQQFRAIPSKLAKPLSMLTNPNEVQVRLQEEIDECLTELTADKKYEQSVDESQPIRSEINSESQVSTSAATET